ncbi:hypothetical protein CFP56_017665 [Quercus suber]|uniref:Uncharacterized protein n=1 Tax=Quercus suber TaxID=58331 RepID=A0AAW0M2W4_QUESU
MVAVEKVVMNMDFGYGFKADDNNNNFVTPQEVDRPPLVEMSTNKHEEANLKRIDPKICSKKADRDGEALLPDRCDAVDLGNSSNHQGVELTQSERDMQVDKGDYMFGLIVDLNSITLVLYLKDKAFIAIARMVDRHKHTLPDSNI